MTAGTSTTADPTVGAAINIARKPGQAWEYGPVCFAGEHKAYVTELNTYLDWVSQVDSKLNDFAAAVQRIRMLYYGQAIGNFALIDKMLKTDPRSAGAPLTTADVPQETLDGLARTGWVSVGANQDRRYLVDISRVWLQLDVAVNGISQLGSMVDMLCPLAGLLNWTGDLAAWWIEYNDQKQCYIKNVLGGQTLTEGADLTLPISWRDSGQPIWCATDALFGDMDGMILAVLGAPQVKAGSKTLTDLLTGYYTASTNTNPSDKTFLHSDNRFHLFAWNSSPAFPVTPSSPAPTGAALTADSGTAIRAIIANAIQVLLGNARGIYPKFMMGVLEYHPPPLSSPTVQEIQQSVQQDLGSPWGTAMAAKMAQDFTNFLTAGLAGTGWTSTWTSDGTPVGWPTSRFAIDTARGGYALQLDDSDASGTYGGQKQSAAIYVANLQNDLNTLCFKGVGTADGVFGPNTAMSLREFQIEASQQQIYAQAAGPPTSTAVLPVIRRYQGLINGVATLETCEALAHWLQPDPPPRHCLAPPGPGQGLAQILNPVNISARSNVSATSDGTIATNMSDMWWYGSGSTAPYPLVYAIDQLKRYTIPQEEVVGRNDPGLAFIGTWTLDGGPGGPVIQQKMYWGSSLVSLANLVPPPLDPSDPAIRSQYRVVRAVAEVEDLGHYDVYNAWDSAILSFGLLHWALQPSGFGELGAFLSFYQNLDPAGYAADFGSMGIQPGAAWDPASLDQTLFIYNNTLAMKGLHDTSGTIQANQTLPLQLMLPLSKQKGVLQTATADHYLGDYLRSWRSLYRIAMTLRTSLPLRRAMWYFATQRVRDLLRQSWPGGSGLNAPLATVGGSQNLATIGQVFTSEQAVAVLLRWHVNRPGDLLVPSTSGTSIIQQAYVYAFGIGIVDLGKVADPNGSQAKLVAQLVALAPNGTKYSFQSTVTTARDYQEAGVGLSAAAGSYLGS